LSSPALCWGKWHIITNFTKRTKSYHITPYRATKISFLLYQIIFKTSSDITLKISVIRTNRMYYLLSICLKINIYMFRAGLLLIIRRH
jgi:hypothetical protein